MSVMAGLGDGARDGERTPPFAAVNTARFTGRASGVVLQRMLGQG